MAESIFRQLANARGGHLTRSALHELITPKGTVAAGSNMLTETLRELLGIGALTEADDTISLSGPLPAGGARSWIRDSVMQAELGVDLWETDEVGSLVLLGARDLVRALAWF